MLIFLWEDEVQDLGEEHGLHSLKKISVLPE
jgi:hypothetical protein